MGFDQGRIVLDNPNGTFYSGQTVQGTLIFQQEKVKSIRGLYVKIKGFCHVHWTTTHSRTVDGKEETYTVNHDSHEEYINSRVYLVGGESGEHTLQPGNYEYPFRFRLPVSCPASFEGEYGHIRYEIKAILDKPFALDKKKKIAVRVIAPLDLNLDPYCRERMDFELQETYCCCCVSSGSTEVVARAPVSGYCPGQYIPLEISCSNRGNVGINNIKLSITKKLTFIATSEPDQKTLKSTVAEIQKGPIPPNTNRNWTVEMVVPALDVYNLAGCQYINMDYKFKVAMNPSGCHTESRSSRKLVIGTFPMVGFQDDVQNPLHDQMPQNVAINQQPTSHPPVIIPYPGNNPQPFVNLQSGNPPYPTSNSPYPDNPPPYPGINPPYPPSGASMPTRDIGFKVPSDGKDGKVPLLPPGAVDLNPQSPPNPYATASAPTLDSPKPTEEKH